MNFNKVIMKKINLFTISSMVLFILSACNNKHQKENLFPNNEVPVKVSKLIRYDTLLSIDATGLISTENEARYAFKIGGIIDKILVKEGEKFEKGQLLATLKSNEIDAGEAQAKLGYEKALRDYKRVQNLYKDSVATLEQLQNTKTLLDITKEQLDAISFNKQYANIYANCSGFVTKKIANEGEIIAAGYPLLAINENKSNEWVLRVGLSDKNWACINLNDQAMIKLEAFPDKMFKGYVSKKLMAADQQSGTFQIELKLDNLSSDLALGMYGKATITTNSKTSFYKIPYEALIEADGNQAFVFTPSLDMTIKKVKVNVNSFDNNSANITADSTISEVVITNSAFLNQNSKIRIIK